MRNFIDIVADGHSVRHLFEAQIDPERAARAAALGFDTSRIWYSGTPSGGFDEFDPLRTADESLAYGKGIYVTADPEAASGYSRPGASWGNHTDDPRPSVYPLYIKAQKPFDLDKAYPFAEVKRILTHCLGEDLDHLDLWKEINDEMGIKVGDDDEYDENEEEPEEFRLEMEIDEWNRADSHEDVDPDDYEEGVGDPEYEQDVKDAIANEIKYVQRRLEHLNRRNEEEATQRAQSIASGRIGSAYGRDIYRTLWTNTEGYHDWKAESQLIGGESEVFEFKTEANEWLEELGYDSITHVDSYNPGKPGQKHNVTILFRPSQVRSIFAGFDPDKSDSGKISD